MYNGIGLSTPRGTGTNGYVQRNLSSFAKKPIDYRKQEPKVRPGKKPNKDLLLHQRKRAIEVECMKLRLELEKQNVNPEEIETKVSNLRIKLKDSKDLSTNSRETHQNASIKERENEVIADALGLKYEESNLPLFFTKKERERSPSPPPAWVRDRKKYDY